MKTLLNQNKSVEAENLGRKLSITYPDHPGILNNLAVSLMRQKRYHEAYPILQRAVDPKIVGQPLPVSINNLEAVTKELERHP
jgi:predicted Zn-dependent protease